MKKSWLLICALVLLFCSIAGAEGSFDISKLDGLNIEEVHVSIPGLEKVYHFLWVSDLHIVIDNEEIAEDQHELVSNRQTSWAIKPDGKQAGDWWVESLAEQINSSNPDAILFGGDMLDLCSEATVEKLKAGLGKITVPYMYIRADHDYRTHWLKEPDLEKNIALQSEICEFKNVFTLEYPEFIILGINESTYQMTPEAVDEAKAIAEQGKPIIVVTHVPYNSIVDNSLDATSRVAWQDRNLTWGKDTSYVPDEKMQEWMDVMYSGGTVKEVLAGHLHLTWDGMISGKVHEHVFSYLFSGNIGLIIVDGE